MDVTENTRPVLCKERIYITGFMGSGKSTVGPLLAELLGWSFSDLDDHIVREIGEPIADFFKEKGEAAFRKIEATQLIATASVSNRVIAVGGGALCGDDNLNWALDHGIVVYIRVPVQVLVDRLKAEQITRPMLLSPDGSLLNDEAVVERISKLIEQREAYYSRSHLTIEAGRAKAEAVAQVSGEKLRSLLLLLTDGQSPMTS